MSKSLIHVIIDELGLSINEEFTFVGYDCSVMYRFTDEGLEFLYEGEWRPSNLPLRLFVIRDIVKPPFFPKVGEMYWTYVGEEFQVSCVIWDGFAIDYFRKACGCVFRTEKEAQKNRNAKYEKYMEKGE